MEIEQLGIHGKCRHVPKCLKKSTKYFKFLSQTSGTVIILCLLDSKI